MSHDDDKPWSVEHEDFDVWYNTSETTDYYKEWYKSSFFLMILVSVMNPQPNISDRIFISANIKYSYETFKADYFTISYWILFLSVHVQQIPLSHVNFYMWS